MEILHQYPRRLWPAGLFWLENLRAPGFNWSIDSVLKSSDSTQCSVMGFDLAKPNSKINAAALYQSSLQAHELLMIATQPAVRGQGHSRALLQSLIDKESHDRPWWLEVHEENVAASGLYISLGFAVVGRRAQYYSDGAACILMSRPMNTI